jgi:hypothetical protein
MQQGQCEKNHVILNGIHIAIAYGCNEESLEDFL